MDIQWITIALGVIGFLIHGATMLVVGTWKLAQVETAVHKSIQDHRREIDSEIDTSMRSIGETIGAMRARMTEIEAGLIQKITEVEIWTRDYCVRRESLQAMLNELKVSALAVDQKLEKRLDRMENKIDQLNEK